MSRFQELFEEPTPAPAVAEEPVVEEKTEETPPKTTRTSKRK